MRRFKVALLAAVLVTVSAVTTASADSLLIPVFAHRISGADDTEWSSELYLVNPGPQPIQVTLLELLPGRVEAGVPCDLFMPPTRVVPPRAAVVWTAAGLATDLGCADRALGALLLNADGRVEVTSRLVNRDAGGGLDGLLTGRGQEMPALPLRALPGAGTYLLPALLWHPDPCGEAAFATAVGFANPGDDAVTIRIDLDPELVERGVLVDGRRMDGPFRLRIPARSWRQVDLEPVESPGTGCRSPESFVAEVTLDGSLAVYASVVDRRSQDARTVLPVPVEEE